MITLSIIIFIIGILLLLFGKTSNPNYDLLGFICILTGYLMLMYLVYHPKIDTTIHFMTIVLK